MTDPTTPPHGAAFMGTIEDLFNHIGAARARRRTLSTELTTMEKRIILSDLAEHVLGEVSDQAAIMSMKVSHDGDTAFIRAVRGIDHPSGSKFELEFVISLSFSSKLVADE